MTHCSDAKLLDDLQSFASINFLVAKFVVILLYYSVILWYYEATFCHMNFKGTDNSSGFLLIR